MKQLLNLNGAWDLYLVPNAEVKRLGLAPDTAADLKDKNVSMIQAEVPGNFELDMERAGLFPDPYMGTNPLLCQKEENKHLFYVKTFTVDEIPENETFLRFEGIDTFAELYLNGEWIGDCDNMLIEHEYPVSNLRLGENELMVHIFPTAIVAREYEGSILNYGMKYNCDSLHIRKAPYMFGWDIMPRTVSGGIWRSVSLIEKTPSRIEEFYLATSSLNPKLTDASLNCFIRLKTDEDLLDGFEAVIRGRCGDSTFEEHAKFWSANRFISLTVFNPKLWWPVRAGEQNLYDVEISLYRNGELCDRQTTRFGIRTVKLDRTSVIDKDGNGKFEFLINGKKIFVMGTNWVPLDAFPSQNEKRLYPTLELVEELGCNMIRLWGGNVYECDAFYDWCDEHGIMLWQDFIMGCGYYPQYEDFCNALREEATVAVKRLRSHASLVLWAGDNECDVFCLGRKKNGVPLNPNDNVLTRKVLPEVLQTYDPYRPYLPSSPYVDDYAFNVGLPEKCAISEEHIWGPRNFFKSSYYTGARCRFASETGFHGCPSPDSLKKYIRPEQLWPHMTESNRPNPDWITHAASMEVEDVGPYEYRIGLMNRQLTETFGRDYADGLPTNKTELNRISTDYVYRLCGKDAEGLNRYARASQIFQAEAMKYIIERFRIRKATHGGLIWWNVMDGWPQISDAVVDYYFCKKLAFDYIKNSQAELCMMFDEPKDGHITLFGANEGSAAHTLSYTVRRYDDGKTVASGELSVDAHGIAAATSIPVGAEEQSFYLIEWTDELGNRGINHYVTNIKSIDLDRYLGFLEGSAIGHFEGFSAE